MIATGKAEAVALFGAERIAAVEIAFPLRTLNPLNRREHWRARSARVKAERAATFVALHPLRAPALPVVVTLTREAVQAMDTDGLAASFKGVRDEIARWLGLDDADPRVEWRYAQARSPRRTFVVRIHVEARG